MIDVPVWIEISPSAAAPEFKSEAEARQYVIDKVNVEIGFGKCSIPATAAGVDYVRGVVHDVVRALPHPWCHFQIHAQWTINLDVKLPEEYRP